MSLKKIAIIFICFAFSCNYVLAADTLHMYEKNERTNYQPEQDEIIYDFSDEAQQEFDRKNLVLPPQQTLPANVPPVSFPAYNVQEEEVIPLQKDFILPQINQSPLNAGVIYIDAGTRLDAMLNSSISSDSIDNNDNVSAELITDWIANGVVIAPEGSILSGSVVDSNKASFAMRNGKIGINFNRIMTPDGRIIQLATNKVYIVGNSSQAKKIAGKVAGGVLSGVAIAAVSMLFGADPKEALIRGAAIGGTIGTISAVATKGEEIMVPEGTSLQIMLSEPMTIQQY